MYSKGMTDCPGRFARYKEPVEKQVLKIYFVFALVKEKLVWLTSKSRLVFHQLELVSASL